MSTGVRVFRVLAVVLLFVLALGFVAGRNLPDILLVPGAEASIPGNEPPPPVGLTVDNDGRPTPEAAAVLSNLALAGSATVFRTYSGTCFTPHGTENAASQYAGGGGIYRVSGTNEFVCPLELPQGARVTEIVWYIRDDTPNSINMWFATYRPDVAQYSNIASLVSTGIDTNAIATPTMTGNPLTSIDNSRYQYVLEVGLNESDSGHAIFGARVGYIPSSTYAPVMKKDSR